MGVAGDLVQEAFRIEERGIDWRAALAGAVAAIGPLAIGVAIDDVEAILPAALGGLNTALCVPRAGLRPRCWWGSLAVVGGVASVALAGAVGPHTWSLVPVTLVWVGAWGFLRAAGPRGALVGFATSAVFTIFAGIPPTGTPDAEQLLWYAVGASAALALMVYARRQDEPSGHVVRDTLDAVRDHALRDASLRAHAVRLGGAVAASTVLYRAIDLPHGYWVPLTTLAILQPGEHATQIRAVQRTAGTLGGAVLIIAITLATENKWALVACAAASAFWLYALDERGYFWLVVLLTPTVLLILSVVDFEGETIAAERVANSAIGIAIGLLIGEVAWRIPAARPRKAEHRRKR
jgi:uncharacterized membrane protein YccC